MQTKHENERRALITLELICDYPKGILRRADKPDLQDFTSSCGIEVVEDCYSNEKETERFISSIWEKEVSDIDPVKIKKLEKLGGAIREEDGHIVSATLGPQTPNNPTHLIETVKSKIGKLNCGEYKEFDTYRLYVFVTTVSLENSYVQSVIDAAARYQNGKKYSYEIIYLDGYFEICVCNISKGTFDRKPISKELGNIISRESNSISSSITDH